MERGEIRQQNSEPTIEDVAASVGVSIRTVSRVLNKSPKVNEETRKRIEQAIADLHFRPSSRARALAMGRSFLIGLVHNDQNALVLDPVQRSIVEITSTHGYELVVHPSPVDQRAAIEDVLTFVQRSRVDGLIVMAPVSGVPGLAAALAQVQIPAIAMSSVPIEGFSEVLLSEERGAGADVARHLIDLGHRRLGIVNGPPNVFSAAERRAGFLEEAARESDATVIEAAGDYGFASGESAAEHLLSLPDRPTGIFAANDIMAAAILKVAATRGIAVPAQLSVVGFDGSILTRMLSPALTSVLRPFGEMAAAAAGRLIARIEGEVPTSDFHAPLRVVPAESSGPAPDRLTE